MPAALGGKFNLKKKIDQQVLWRDGAGFFVTWRRAATTRLGFRL
jgi:hypothetical protein